MHDRRRATVVPSSASNSERSSAAGLKTPWGARFSVYGRLCAPGMCPATGSIGSSRRENARAPARRAHRASRRRGAAGSRRADDVGAERLGHERRRVSRRGIRWSPAVPRHAICRSRRRGPPPRRGRASAAATTIATPTCRCSGRRRRPASRRRCRRGRASRRARSTSGSGWRPLLPVLRAGQVAVHVQEARRRDVRQAVGALARIDVAQVVAAIDDDERGIVQMQGEFAGGDEGGVFHGRDIAAGRNRPATTPVPHGRAIGH